MGAYNFKNENVFNYLKEIEKIRNILKKQNPSFKFSSDKGDVAEVYVKSVFGLKQATYGKAGYDLISSGGIKVSVKNIWEYNKYRAVSLSGGSNQTKNAYKKADQLICLGRDFNGDLKILSNIPIKFLKKYLKGGNIHPRIELRSLIKLNSLMPDKYKLKPIKKTFKEADPIFYIKDLYDLFNIPKNFWSNLRTSWRNQKNKIHKNVDLKDFMTSDPFKNQRYGLILSKWDLALFCLTYDFVKDGIDYRTSVYLAFHKLIKKNFPQIKRSKIKLITKFVSETGFKNIKRDLRYKNYFSIFLTGDFALNSRSNTYFTTNDLKILSNFKNKISKSRGGNQKLWHSSLISSCKKFNKTKEKFNLINPKKIKFDKYFKNLNDILFEKFIKNI